MLDALKGRLIASCQAYPGEPMRDPDTMRRVAQSCVIGGAAAIRAQGLADVQLIKAAVEVPVIGLWKDGKEGVFITPTLEHAVAVAAVGADIVAIDATLRPRPDGLTFTETVRRFRERCPGVLVMADCDGVESAKVAQGVGVDLLGTTLAGYTDVRPKTTGPDLDLLTEIAGFAEVPLIAEGRIHTPQQARQALDAGADAVVVGTAITHPATITGWFVDALA
ncbi:MAG: N-acetylmannosamine-6-phosphate 2-epimerase [Propionibacteriaceae bacterium]|nr:N-acetylmannosamine-6-phosphate 2-epimerase [Propionibacteriaceae bacterium]